MVYEMVRKSAGRYKMKICKYFLLIILVVLISCDTPVVSLPPPDNGPAIEKITASEPDINSIVKLTFLFKEDVFNLKKEDMRLSANFIFIVLEDSFVRPDEGNYKKYELDIIPGASGSIRVAISPYTFAGWSVESVQVNANYNFVTAYNPVENNYDVTINKYNKTGGSVIIPEKFGNYPVKRILGNAFSGAGLTDAVIPNSVIAIEQSAFLNNKLASVTIPDSITNINSYTFSNNQLTSINIPDSVIAIGTGAFSNNLLASVSIPEGVLSLSGFNNNKLSIINIPAAVKNIGDSAFENNNLTEVNFADNGDLAGIGNNAFACNQLDKIKIPQTVTAVGIYAFAYNLLSKVEIPDTVSFLSGFNDNQLTEIEIPESVVNIGAYAFANNKIDEIKISKNVRNIGHYSFANNRISVLTFEDDIELAIINEGAFQNNLLTEITIPGNVTVSNTAFTGNQLTKITIGNNVILSGIVFGNGFEAAYNNNREAGTYKRDNVNTNIWYLE